MNNRIEVPHFSLSPRVLTLYTTLEGNCISDRQRETFENLEDNKNKFNELSQHSVKRLRRAINFMIYTTAEKQIKGKIITTKNQDYTTEYEKAETYQKSVNYKLAMITLTLPSSQVHDDETIKSKCLNQFLIEIKEKFGCRDYIWKAEKQENNNIHFHILINRYIHHKKIKSIWNRCTEKLGYVSAYSNNMKNIYSGGFKPSTNVKDRRTVTAQLAAYNAGKSVNWTEPNSTDIHSLYKVKNAGAYLTKYLAKGVTKTERIQQITDIRKKLIELETLKINIDKKILFDPPPPAQLKTLEENFKTLENHIKDLNTKLSELLKTGISGRIWGQSQSLSKLKPFTSVENWDNVPEIDTVKKNAEFTIINDIGSRKIYSYIFNIQKFSTLNDILKNHLNNISSSQPPN